MSLYWPTVYYSWSDYLVAGKLAVEVLDHYPPNSVQEGLFSEVQS